jgi:hypothetical protein
VYRVTQWASTSFLAHCDSSVILCEQNFRKF